MKSLCDSAGVDFYPERLGMLDKPGTKADVLLRGPEYSALAVECEYPPQKPDEDAISRLGAKVKQEHGGSVIDTVIAVIPPADGRKVHGEQNHKKHLIEGAPIQYAVHKRDEDGTPDRWPSSGYIEGTVATLTELAVHLLVPPQTVQNQAESAAETMKGISNELDKELRKNSKALEGIAQVMGRPSGADSLNVVGVVWLNAFLFQDRIAEHHESVPHRIEIYSNNSNKPVPSKVIRAWQSVININYESVYTPALNALKSLESAIGTQKTASLLERASSLAEDIQSSSLGVFDIGGELFPRLLSDRSESASYYTRPEVAEFLAHMAVPAGWQPPSSIDEIKVGDFACGTGTLLRAGYRRIRAMVKQGKQGGAKGTDIKNLHKHMMENGIAGFDISPIAAHLTASSLSNIQPEVDYRHSNIGVVSVCQPWSAPSGSRKGKTRTTRHATTGSLDFLEARSMEDLFGERITGTTGAHSLLAEDKSFDLVLMNPPYSRTRGGQALFDIAGATEENRKMAQKRASYLLKKSPANLKAGLGSAFCDLARLKLKPGGRLGIVLPMTAASSPAWAKTRQMLEDEFDDLCLIAYLSGAAGGEDAMSADTSMGEMLLVGTKRENKLAAASPLPNIVTVTVKKSFTTVSEAMETARAITAQIARQEASKGVIYVGDDQAAEWLRSSSVGGIWTGVGVKSFELLTLVDRFTQSGRFQPLNENQDVAQIPMTTLYDLFGVGPTHDLIGHPHGGDGRGAFEFHELSQDSKRMQDLSLWAANSKTQTSIRVNPTHYGTPMATNDEVTEMRDRRSTLYYQRNMRWTSQKIICAVTDQPHMGGNAWTTLSHDDEAVRFGFALWANSSLGMLVHWSRSQRQQLGRGLTKIGAVKQMPCPDFEDQALLAAARSMLKQRPDLLDVALKPANASNHDPGRTEINEAVSEMFKLDPGSLADIADVWCDEPAIIG